MRNLANGSRLALRDWWIAGALLLLSVGYRTDTISIVERILRVYVGAFASIGRSTVSARAIGQRVHRVGTCLPFVACLEEAVVCHAVLEAHGIDSRFHLGVAKPRDDVLVAHAWVTADDRVVVGDGDLSEYTPLSLEQGP